MIEVARVVLPVFLLIFLGHLLRRRAFPGEGFWAPAERLTYFLLFPALIAATLAKAEFDRLEVLPMAGALILAILVMTALALVFRPWLGTDGPAFTSLYQAVVRMNTYIGLSVAFGVKGTDGLAAAALAVAVIVPLVNLLSVAVLARFGSAGQPSAAGVLRQVASNPLILAAVFGLLLNVTGLGLPPILGPLLEILARGALPLGLLCVGAALSFSAARASGRLALLASVMKLLLLPLITWGTLQLFDVAGVAAFVAILFNGLPTATSSYILARQLGGDAPLMASLTTVETLLSLLTLPLVLSLLA